MYTIEGIISHGKDILKERKQKKAQETDTANECSEGHSNTDTDDTN